MKKFLYIGFFLFALILFSACQPFWAVGERVGAISFYLDDGDVPKSAYSESSLNVVPNYEDRSLNVSYSRVFPMRTDETVDEDIRNSGVIAGTFFDRFEEIVKAYREGTFDGLNGVKSQCVMSSNFSFAVEDLNGNFSKVVFEVCPNETDAGKMMLETFYRDVTNLFSQDIY